MLYDALTNVTRLATPMFLLFSGFVAAYVLSSGKMQARMSLLDRGLFVLVSGHLLLNWRDLSVFAPAEWMFARVTVTDAIAVCLIAAAFAARARTGALAGTGVFLALASWPIAALWIPTSEIERYIGITLFNVRSESSALTNAALVPYVGLFLLGMTLSRWCSADLMARDYTAAARRLALIGTLAVSFVLLGIATWYVLKHTLLVQVDPELLKFVQLTLDPRSKMPPSPAYLLFYGGGGLVIAAMCLLERPRVLMRPIVNRTATLGRASLMCFVVQDWLLVLLPAVLGFNANRSMAFWTAYLLATLIALHAFSTRWDRAKANRFLSVGLKRVRGSARGAQASVKSKRAGTRLSA